MLPQMSAQHLILNILRWNHINLPELNCLSMCLVKLSMHNGTGIGYYSPSTCTQFASQVGRCWTGGYA